MASTRNRNTAGNYKLEQNINTGQLQYFEYVNSTVPLQTLYPGNGLLMGQIGHSGLSYNGADIESYLRGIGSTNLVEPQTDPVPQYKSLKSLNIINRIPMIIPEPLVVKSGERYPIS